MELQRLNKEQTVKIYQERMKTDFPPTELKPLSMIHKMMEKGIYEPLGLMEHGEMVGYTYLLKNKKDYLIDYVAIYPNKRDLGYGSEMLRLLSEYLTDAESIIGEVEDPEHAKSKDEQETMERRIRFYMKNGFRDTGVRVICFQEPFVLIETGKGLLHTEEEVRKLYRMHYRAMLPEKIFKKNVIV